MDNNNHPQNKYVLSVVIPTVGRAYLIKTISSLMKVKDAENIEVIVVGRIADESILKQLNELMLNHSNIRHIDVTFSTGDSSHKKNKGWQSASTELIAFLDDDVLLDELWAKEIITTFRTTDASLVSGPALLPEDTNMIGRLAAETLSSLAAGYVAWRYSAGKNDLPHSAKWSRLIGCNMAYKKEILEKIGGFDPFFWPGEEMLAAFKATKSGGVLIFNPQAKVYHYPRSTIYGFARQMYGYGATRIRLIRAGVEVEVSTLGPLLLIIGSLALLVSALFSKTAMIVLLWFWLIYLAGAIFVTLIKIFETKNIYNLAIFLMIIVMHLSYGTGELYELLFPNKDLSLKNK